MIDEQVLNAKRRNFMILNTVVFLLAITGEKITSFEFIGKTFEIKESFYFIDSFNILIYITWVYFLFGFVSAYKYLYIKEVIEKEAFKTPFKDFESKRDSLSNKMTHRLLSYLKYLSSAGIYDFFIPIIFFIINITILDISFYSKLYFIVFVIYLVLSFAYEVAIIEVYKIKKKKEKLIEELTQKNITPNKKNGKLIKGSFTKY